MKIKILLAPSLIVLIIVAIIWYVYPAYTNGIDGVKEKNQKSLSQKQLMEKLDSSSRNAAKLVAELEIDSPDNALVYGYIPKNKEEERIIENLNVLAKDSALSVLNISVLEEKKDSSASAQEATENVPVDPFSAVNITAPIQAPVTPKAVPKSLKVSLSLVGDYANIKNLLEKVQKLKRFNAVSTLEIKTLLKEDQSVSESLQADIVLEFNYLSELKRLVDGDINNAVFSAGAFSKTAIDKIRDNRSIEVSTVIPGEKGGNNPFIIAK
jgi:Tfp pilus assembly protein PilO